MAMKLLSTVTSPFSRKVLVLAHEKGVRDLIETVTAEVGTHVPLATPAHDSLGATNPLIKIPVLIDGDLTLFDSRVIVEYVDSLWDDPRMIPSSGPARWLVLKQQALADGILDAALLCRFELARAPVRWPAWSQAQLRRITQGVDALASVHTDPTSHIDIGSISAGCALGYLDFRFPTFDWRSAQPTLANWFAVFEARPSMQATRPICLS